MSDPPTKPPTPPTNSAPPGAPSEAPAWSEQNLSDPHATADKAQRVQKMFSAIAKSYDLNNRLHSMWRDQAWRRKAVRLCDIQPTDVVLDVACGTGDLSLAFADAKPARVLGVDFTHAMLQVAGEKHRQAPPPVPVSFADGDAMRLPLADNSVDVVSIAFGIRNVADHAAAIQEFRRVLKPGGRLCILEFSLPSNPLLRGMYNFYFRHVMPRTATLISGDRSGAYRYLPQSVNTFINRDTLVASMQQAGFTAVAQHPMTFGIAVAYLGRA
ncbi:MAG: bifunctional demethylmenaquinone methyltransferase/2-methoxy-6-polyprenyl-1,4-benzoquinol methylase UbiE [Phycisphaeraceae bacterium]